jgi:hypothetical protein
MTARRILLATLCLLEILGSAWGTIEARLAAIRAEGS